MKQMGFGKAKKATSPFQTIKEFRVNLGPLGTGISSSDGSTLNAWYVASPELKTTQSRAINALNNNMQILEQSPTQQLADVDAGKNAFYNASKASLNQDVATQMAKAQLRFGRQGLQNSTTSGAFQGQIASEATLRDLMTKFSSLDYLNNNARQTASSAMDTIAGLTDIAQSTAARANDNFLAAYGDRSTTERFNVAEANASRRAKMRLFSTGLTDLSRMIGRGSNPTNPG
jgi:hypothetical protein